MLVRIRSRDGNFRFDVQPTDDISVLIQKILETSTSIDPSTLALSNTPRDNETLVSQITGDLAGLGLSHGDLLFASYKPLNLEMVEIAPTGAFVGSSATLSGKIVPSVAVTDPKPTNAAPKGARKLWEEAEEDDVDKFWGKKDGKVQQKKGSGMCKCGPKAMCDYCMPLEPFDAPYQQAHAIKHLSYHSYLRKLNASAPLSAQSTSYIPPLSNPSYQVQVPCTSESHPSWPAGICTKCQPSAVTLSRQTYRLVDHVEFANPELIEGLLNFWRSTGNQRFGYLLGRLEPYDEVPMGIKAVVEAIHEPPQEGLADGVEIGFPWEDEERVQKLAKACGLSVVGMIYTDLIAEDKDDASTKSGMVKYKRHANSFFLSSLEVIFSATIQRRHPNPSKFSDSGKFSSKFVTCVLSGDKDGQIAVEAYQVSDQAMAMVEADMIEASVDPGVMRVKEEEATRYIPDVFFRYKNSYGIEVKESAKPCFPVEYLLVNVSHGFPKQINPLFTTSSPFNTENRAGFQDQTVNLVASRFNDISKGLSPAQLGREGSQAAFASSDKGKGREADQDGALKIVKWLSDWHLLAFLDSLGIFTPEDIALMARIGATKDLASLAKLFDTSSWQTFLTIAQEEAPSVPTRDYPGAPGAKFDDGFEIPEDVDVPPEAQFNPNQNQGGDVSMDDASGAGGGGGGSGICPTCTFENDHTTGDCEMCGLPL